MSVRANPVETDGEITISLCTASALHAGWARVLANIGGPGGDRVTVHSFGLTIEGEIDRFIAHLQSDADRLGPVSRAAISERSGSHRLPARVRFGQALEILTALPRRVDLRRAEAAQTMFSDANRGEMVSKR